MKTLLAGDKHSLDRAKAKIFGKNNYPAETVYSGEDALKYIENGNYEAAILDILLPGTGGITVLKKLRSRGIAIPILKLAARSEVDGNVLGLDRAMLRGHQATDSKLTPGNITLDSATFELSSQTDSFRFADKEFQVMGMLTLKGRKKA